MASAPPELTSSKIKSQTIYDSLRFSYDFDQDSALSYSEDGGQEIDF